MPSEIRHQILQEWDYSFSRIIKASREVGEARERRARTRMRVCRRERMKKGLRSLLIFPALLTCHQKKHKSFARQDAPVVCTRTGLEVRVVAARITIDSDLDSDVSTTLVEINPLDGYMSIASADALSSTHHRHIDLGLSLSESSDDDSDASTSASKRIALETDLLDDNMCIESDYPRSADELACTHHRHIDLGLAL